MSTSIRTMRKPSFYAFGLAFFLTISAVLLLRPRETPAELEGPRASDRQVALIVTALLNQEHLLNHPLDDEISERALSTYLKGLDPMKVYFYQSDIDEFMKERKSLDDMIKRGDLSLAYRIFNRFLERVDERVEFVDVLLKQQHDFEVDEVLITDRDEAKYATTPAEAFDRWRRRIKYDLLVLKSEDAKKKEEKKEEKKEGDADKEKNDEVDQGEAKQDKSEDPTERLKRRYHSYAKRMHQFSSDDLLEMYLSAITTAYDPHTTYMSPSSLENFHISMKLKLEGIGAALMMNDGYTVVTKVIPGGAADKNGKLQPEDRIVSVGQGTDGEMVDVVDMNLNDVVKMIRGKAGTVVRLGVKPAGGNEVEIVKITRAKIELKDSEARSEVIPFGKKPDGSSYEIGVIDLPSFYMDMSAARKGLTDFKSTTRDVRRILEDFKSKGVDAVVLDLTRNGGGSLTEAINLTGLFIDRGPVVQVKDSDARVQHYDDTESGMVWDGPLVVMTSKFSASASEILAGAIQDYGRGIIIGDVATHGKGTVQSLLDLGNQIFNVPNPPNLGALKITMQQFYRPNGDSTQKRGVVVDVPMPSLTTHMDVGETDLDYPVKFDEVEAAPFKKVDDVTTPVVKQLNNLSAKRREGSEDFAKLNRRVEQYKKQKARKSVTLNEKKFFAERAELDADKEEEKKIKEQVSGERPVFRRNYYNDEVLAITVDYLQLLKDLQVAGSPKSAGTTP
ncbi:MAG: carboxy terminal-processing peptidase [Pirellulaceae bacterium]|nr:carboxy terminal-processing peptidase [Pirellulaceae bacterium]